MASTDFVPNDCRKCGCLVWEGYSSSGFLTRLDIEPLSIVDEIMNFLAKNRSYQIHRTAKSFEATPRLAGRMGKVHPIVLRQHICRTLLEFGVTAPDYWATTKPTPPPLNEKGFPF
jgi:hypothetical protein